MSKNRNDKNGMFHVIPMRKGFVRGYYEKRDGKLVWVSPYENSKDRQTKASNSKVTKVTQTQGVKPPAFDETGTRLPVKPVPVVNQEQGDKYNFLLEAIIRCVQTIDAFEPGEIVKLKDALKVAKSIVSELGYLDGGIAASFTPPPDAKQTKLGAKAARETGGMIKELTRLTRRITKSTLREKVRKMALVMEEAL